ncbi:MAG: transposase [candidate division KSB1 bacterium]|nr:transposase [candidate division KSB1 bacterium]
MKKAKNPSLPASRKGKTASAAPMVINPKLELVQLLIPIALERVNEILQDEVTSLAGPRYARDTTNRAVKRWGKQAGSVYLADQKVPLRVPRVRDVERNCEIPLASYHQLQRPRATEEQLFVRIIRGLSCQNYERAAQLVPEAFGLSRSNISRRFIRTSAKKLQMLLNRRLEQYEFVALVLDGKTFRQAQMVIALGITKSGEKIILGFIETATENHRVCAEFLQGLIARGLEYQQGLLVVIDGGKGLRTAIAEVFGDYALVQRCQWHKRENVVAYLPTSQQARMRQKLQQAYEQPTYVQAKQALLRIRTELVQLNPTDAVNRRLPVSMKVLKRRSRCIGWDFSKNWGSV